jgi:hypothetical protein
MKIQLELEGKIEEKSINLRKICLPKPYCQAKCQTYFGPYRSPVSDMSKDSPEFVESVGNNCRKSNPKYIGFGVILCIIVSADYMLSGNFIFFKFKLKNSIHILSYYSVYLPPFLPLNSGFSLALFACYSSFCHSKLVPDSVHGDWIFCKPAGRAVIGELSFVPY